MQQGLVALIDALGFRGIWAQFAEEKLLATLRRVRDEARLRDPNIHMRLLSDTIVLASPLIESEEEGQDGYELICRFIEAIAAVQAVAALSDPPLLYRGCIAQGSVLVNEEFIVGQAVDEAAEWMEQADGALVWLTPSALKLHRLGGPSRIAEEAIALEYDVPLRDGRNVRTLVVNPIRGYPRDGSGRTVTDQELATRIGAAFERPSGRVSVEVLIKRQQTEAFLRSALSHVDGVREAEASLRRHIYGGVDPLDDPPVE